MLDFSRPGKPPNNVFAKAFNDGLQTEFLNAHWFSRLDNARVKCEVWRRDHNEHRPHSCLGNQTPMERVFSSGQACLLRRKESRFFGKDRTGNRARVNTKIH